MFNIQITKNRKTAILSLFPWLLFLIFHQTLFARDTETDKQLFQKAQTTFNQAQQMEGNSRKLTMLKAANQFEKLFLEYGVKNGYLFYNIGNAYYQAGEKGKAILYYRRAQRLIPGFSDLNFNLNVVQQELEVPEPKKTWWREILKNMFFWHYMFDFSLRRGIAITGFILFWILMSLLVFYKSSLVKAGLVVAGLTVLSFGGSFLLSAYKINVETSGVVIKNQSEVRKGPGSTYESVYERPLSEGTEFDLLEVHGEWWKVKLANNDVVWLKASQAEII